MSNEKKPAAVPTAMTDEQWARWFELQERGVKAQEEANELARKQLRASSMPEQIVNEERHRHMAKAQGASGASMIALGRVRTPIRVASALFKNATATGGSWTPFEEYTDGIMIALRLVLKKLDVSARDDRDRVLAPRVQDVAVGPIFNEAGEKFILDQVIDHNYRELRLQPGQPRALVGTAWEAVQREALDFTKYPKAGLRIAVLRDLHIDGRTRLDEIGQMFAPVAVFPNTAESVTAIEALGEAMFELPPKSASELGLVTFDETKLAAEKAEAERAYLAERGLE